MSPTSDPRLEERLLVRAPGDTWSAEFRAELQKDRRFEGSLLIREMAVLILVLAIIALRLLLT